MGFSVLNPGDLRHRVQVQHRVESRNPEGDVIETWQTVFPAWASIEPMRGRERWMAEQVRSDITHRIRMQWRDNVTSSHRIRFGFRNFNITSAINEGENNMVLELMVMEDVS